MFERTHNMASLLPCLSLSLPPFVFLTFSLYLSIYLYYTNYIFIQLSMYSMWCGGRVDKVADIWNIHIRNDLFKSRSANYLQLTDLQFVSIRTTSTAYYMERCCRIAAMVAPWCCRKCINFTHG